MAHDLREVLRVQRVEHIEEIISGRAFPLRILVRKVREEVRVLGELWVEVGDAELVVLRYLDFLDLLLLE